MNDTKEREIVVLRDELTASKGKCEVVESELAKINRRYVCDRPYLSHYLVLHPLQLALFQNLNCTFLFTQSFHTQMYRLAALRSEHEELKVAKETIESEFVSVKKRLVHTITFGIYFLHMLSPPVQQVDGVIVHICCIFPLCIFQVGSSSWTQLEICTREFELKVNFIVST